MIDVCSVSYLHKLLTENNILQEITSASFLATYSSLQLRITVRFQAYFISTFLHK